MSPCNLNKILCLTHEQLRYSEWYVIVSHNTIKSPYQSHFEQT